MTSVSLPRLHLIGPLDVVPLREYVEIARTAAEAAPLAVHVRAPGAGAAEVLSAVRALRDGLPDGSLLIMNDRIDIALLANADGVQLGEASFRIGDARRLVGHRLIGRSIHDTLGANAASQDGADFVLAGNIFPTPSKPDMAGRGIEWLGDVVSAVQIPVIALGGVTVERLDAVMATGSWGVAMGREILRADNPAIVAEVAQQRIVAVLNREQENRHATRRT